MIAKTCEEYVLQLLDAARADNETLREDKLELQEELDFYREPTTRAVIAEGRRSLLDAAFYPFANRAPKDGETFGEWAERVTFLPKRIREQFVTEEHFVTYFNDEYQAAYAEACAADSKPVEG